MISAPGLIDSSIIDFVLETESRDTFSNRFFHLKANTKFSRGAIAALLRRRAMEKKLEWKMVQLLQQFLGGALAEWSRAVE